MFFFLFPLIAVAAYFITKFRCAKNKYVEVQWQLYESLLHAQEFNPDTRRQLGDEKSLMEKGEMIETIVEHQLVGIRIKGVALLSDRGLGKHFDGEFYVSERASHACAARR